MLAGIRDYLRMWQLAPMLLLVTAWLWGGSWLLLRSLKKRDYPKRITQSRCVLIFLLAGLAGSMTAAVFFLLVHTCGSTMDTDLRAVGLLVALGVFGSVAALVIYAMLELPIVKSMKVAARPLAVMLAVVAVGGAATAWPTIVSRRRQMTQLRCQGRLSYIFSAIESYERVFGKPADSLQELIDENIIDAADLLCPATKGEASYFYYPGRVVAAGQSTDQVLVCDYRDNHPGGRNVLPANGQASWYSRGDFQNLMTQEQNKEFAEALEAAEGE